jgi:uncharacterized sodium:solute symporter family permease YidK
LHEFHFLGVVFISLIILMLAIGSARPRETPWQQANSLQVDLTPWKPALPFGLGLIAIVLAIYFLIYLQIEAYVISPRVMKVAVSVPAPIVVIAALSGGALLGILGALVAIPFAASVIFIVREIFIPRQNAL